MDDIRGTYLTHHPIPDAALDQHIAILGKTRSGKSSVARMLVEGLLDAGKPVCIVDPKGDWWGLKSSADGRKAGYPVIIFGGEHADIPINAHSGAHVAELVATGNRPCIIDLGGWMPGERTRFWIDFASALFRHTRGMRWLVVDECHNFAAKGKIMDPDAGKALHWANRLASEGLGKGIHMVFASQRPQKVHNDTLTSAETLIAMRVLHPSDREAISDWIKGCGDAKLGAQVMNSLADMKRGEGWVWSPEIGFGPERVQFPLFKTYDSFKARDTESTERLKGWATVDLDEVRAKLAAAVEEAKNNDPKHLKAEIARLQRELASKQGEKINTADPKEIEHAHRTGYDQGWAVGHDAGLRDAARIYLKRLTTITDYIASAAQHTSELVDMATKDRDAPKREYELPAATKPATNITRNITAPVAQRTERRISNPQAAGSSPAGRSNSEVSPARQKILDALAWLEAVGIAPADKNQLALLIKVSPTSGGYFNNLGALRSAGLIVYPQGGTAALTEAGRSLAAAPNAPPTTAELHAQIERLLPPAKWKIVAELIAVYPNDLHKDDLANRIGVSPTSGGYFNNLGSLRTLGLVEYPRGGFVVARSVLFLEGE